MDAYSLVKVVDGALVDNLNTDYDFQHMEYNDIFGLRFQSNVKDREKALWEEVFVGCREL